MTMVREKFFRIFGVLTAFLVAIAIVKGVEIYLGEILAGYLFAPSTALGDLEAKRMLVLLVQTRLFDSIYLGMVVTTVLAFLWIVSSAFIFRPKDPINAARKHRWLTFLLAFLVLSLLFHFWNFLWSTEIYHQERRYLLVAVVLAINLGLFWLASCVFTWRPIRPGVPGARWCRW